MQNPPINKRSLASWGRVVFVRNLGFHANLKSVKIYNLFIFNFQIAAVCIFGTVVLGIFSPTRHRLSLLLGDGLAWPDKCGTPFLTWFLTWLVNVAE